MPRRNSSPLSQIRMKGKRSAPPPTGIKASQKWSTPANKSKSQNR